jgi:hypothetical protein
LADAELKIGQIYAAGRGVERDDGKAKTWLLEAVRQGLNEGFSALASLAEAPQDGVPDPQRAYMWYQMVDGAIGWMQRARLYALLTPEARAEAETMAKTCQASGYYDC